MSVLLLLGPVLSAEQLPVKKYTSDDGLVIDGSINKIVEDSRGFLWIGTRAGLSRFDGESFRNYTVEQGLPHAFVSDILQRRNGEYWIATEGGIGRYNAILRDGKRFTTIRVGEGGGVNSLLEDRQGRIWAGTGRGLFVAEAAAGDPQFHFVMRPEPASTGVWSVGPLLEDRSGALWIGSHFGGLYRRTPDGKITRYGPDRGVPLSGANALFEDRQGRIWLACSRGLFELIRDPGPAGMAVARSFTKRDGLPHDDVVGIEETPEGELWLTTGGGLVHISQGRVRSYTMENGLSQNLLSSLHAGREGDLWIGTDSAGIMRLRQAGLTTYDRLDGVARAPIPAVFSSRSGAVIAVEGIYKSDFLLNRWNGERFEQTRPLFPPSVKSFGWGRERIALQDHTGEWWLASYYGLVRFPRTDRLEDLARTRPAAVYTMADGLPTNNIFSLYEDSRGDIWVGLMWGPRFGTARWDRQSGKFVDHSRDPGMPADKTPSCFAEDRAGNVWIGFGGGGVRRFRSGAFRRFSDDGTSPGSDIYSMYVDVRGRLWIGSARGLCRCDDPSAELPHFTCMKTSQGALPIVFAITGDREGRIYAGTALGVDRIDPKTGSLRHYGTGDGLANNEVLSAFSDTSGDLWFGTQTGVSRLRVVDEPARDPPVAWISAVRVADRQYEISDLGERQVEGLRIKPGQNLVQIDYAGSSLADTLRYQYNLNSGEQDWSAPTRQRAIAYSGLRAGNYRFLVRAVDRNGISGPAASVQFTVLPPFWQQWWFISLAACCAAASIYALYRLRLNRLLQIERVRTRIATDLHDDIGSSLSQIAILSEVARQRLRPDEEGLTEPLTRIAGLSRELTSSIGDIVWAINPHRDSLGDLTQRMRRFATDVFSAREVDFDFTVPPDAGDLKLDIDLRRQIFLIFKEGVHNVLRHSKCSRAGVALQCDGRRLTLEIVDDGKGLDTAREGSGHGLRSMLMRAERLGGTLTVESAPGRGTRLLVAVPLSQKTKRAANLPA